MDQPLVTIICLCYNHERFLEEALRSVISQSYPEKQIIVVDDASTDNSPALIRKVIGDHPAIEFLPLPHNSGICSAFNRGLALAKGEFIIDFATDDVMMPEKIRRQVEFFSRLDASYGVIFSDAVYINTHGKFVRSHFQHLLSRKLISRIPEGNIYRDVLYRYFIPSPTMMVRRKVFDHLVGYDENLSYEDFDFWVRSARAFRYAFQPEKLMKIRLTERSMSKGWYRRGDPQLYSTYLVCEKAITLNDGPEDDLALAKRLRYEIRQSVLSENHKEAGLFFRMLNEIGYLDYGSRIMMIISRLRLPFGFARRYYQRIRFGKIT